MLPYCCRLCQHGKFWWKFQSSRRNQAFCIVGVLTTPTKQGPETRAYEVFQWLYDSFLWIKSLEGRSLSGTHSKLRLIQTYSMSDPACQQIPNKLNKSTPAVSTNFVDHPPSAPRPILWFATQLLCVFFHTAIALHGESWLLWIWIFEGSRRWVFSATPLAPLQLGVRDVYCCCQFHVDD